MKQIYNEQIRSVVINIQSGHEKKMIYSIILCGGSGSRLWPASREDSPKQYISIDGRASLFQKTVDRALNIVEKESELIIVTNQDQLCMAREQIRQRNVKASYIVEPSRRNTAPAVVAAALVALAKDKNAVLVVYPSDQEIADTGALRDAVKASLEFAGKGNLVTLGIVPSRAETGYGYIKKGKKISDHSFEIEAFEEKPNECRAKKFVETDNYLWNCGIFVFRADMYLEEIDRYNPEIKVYVQKALQTALIRNSEMQLDANEFSKTQNISIDYAVMEKTKKAVVTELLSPWSDLGSWKAIYDISEKDSKGNVILGDVELLDSNNCYIQASSRLIAAINLENLTVIDTEDALLIVPTDKAQKVKNIVDLLKERKHPEILNQKVVSRPWGKYERLAEGERFQVKRITVHPGEQLSLQKHYHRAEHWIVVQGSAEVTVGDKVQLLTENQSVYIPVGTVHQLLNPGKIPLVLIEVQSGSYLSEDDIVRLSDKYGRAA